MLTCQPRNGTLSIIGSRLVHSYNKGILLLYCFSTSSPLRLLLHALCYIFLLHSIITKCYLYILLFTKPIYKLCCADSVMRSLHSNWLSSFGVVFDVKIIAQSIESIFLLFCFFYTTPLCSFCMKIYPDSMKDQNGKCDKIKTFILCALKLWLYCICIR